MKRTGRYVMLFIVILVSTEFTIYDYMNDRKAVKLDLIIASIIVAVAWYLGKQFDKAKFYSQELKTRQDEFQQIFDDVDVGYWSINFRTNECFISNGIEKIYGFDHQDFLNHPTLWEDVIHAEDKEKIKDMDSKREYRIICSDGETRWIQDHITQIFSSQGTLIKKYGVAIDITERKNHEEEVKHLAYHDSLTGLPNRYLLRDYVNNAMNRYKHSNQTMAVMFIDLDRFKDINDTLGHNIGDRLLQKVTEILKSSIRQGDRVFRYGGDEFVLLLENADKEDASTVAQRILDNLSYPITLSGYTVAITPSIGICLNHEEYYFDKLLDYADAAMYSAKKLGKNNYQFYIN